MGSLDENVSYWMATAPGTGFPRYAGDDLKVDVAVLGGGITGLMTALLLKQAGASVALVEAGRVACGVTGHTTGRPPAGAPGDELTPENRHHGVGRHRRAKLRCRGWAATGDRSVICPSRTCHGR